MNEKGEITFLSSEKEHYSKDIPLLKFQAVFRCPCVMLSSGTNLCKTWPEENWKHICSICLSGYLYELKHNLCKRCELLKLPADEFSVSYDECHAFFNHKGELFYQYSLYSRFDKDKFCEAFAHHARVKANKRIALLEEQVRKLTDFMLSLELHPEGEEAERAVKRARAVALKL